MSTWFYRKADETEVEMNFMAPEGAELINREVLFPLYEEHAPDHEPEEEDPEVVVAVKQMTNFVRLEITDDAKIDLNIDPQVTPGALLLLKITADDGGDYDVTLGDGFDADIPQPVTVPAEKTLFLSFLYDGTAFVPMCMPDAQTQIALIDARVAAIELAHEEPQGE